MVAMIAMTGRVTMPGEASEWRVARLLPEVEMHATFRVSTGPYSTGRLGRLAASSIR